MRDNVHKYYLDIARLTATRSTCVRRSVGCVLVNAKRQVLSTGYNGLPKDFPHCNEGQNQCSGANAESGTKLEQCMAVHAEQNALLQCKDVDDIAACYVTTSPCIHCMKMLLNTECRVIFCSDVYDREAVRLWTSRGRSVFVWCTDHFELVDTQAMPECRQEMKGTVPINIIVPVAGAKEG